MKSLKDLSSDMHRKVEAMKKLETTFPVVIGVESVKVIKNNFRLQAYSGGAKWKKRSKVTDTIYDYNRDSSYRTPKLRKISKHRNPYKGSVVSSKNPVLKQTGNLRDSATFQASGKQVTIGLFTKPVVKNGKTVDTLVYGKIHNEGGTIKMFGKHNVRIPKRQFMPLPTEGPNKVMQAAYRKKYKEKLDEIMGTWKV